MSLPRARGPRTRRTAVGATTGQGGTSLGRWWPRRSKYGATKTVVDGWTFHSKAEAKRYSELLLLGLAGEIRNLELQPRFPLVVHGVKVADYISDFRYQQAVDAVRVHADGRFEQVIDWDDVVEDVKGMKTPVYVLKRKLFMAQYPLITFRETR